MNTEDQNRGSVLIKHSTRPTVTDCVVFLLFPSVPLIINEQTPETDHSKHPVCRIFSAMTKQRGGLTWIITPYADDAQLYI